jgi:hypothetical protein
MPLPPPHRPIGPGFPIRFEQLDPDIQTALLAQAGLLSLAGFPVGGTWNLGGTDLTLTNGHLKLGTVAKAIYERGRSIAMGEVVDVAFDAANFGGLGGMTWTLAAGDQISFSYALVGKLMFVMWDLRTTSVGGVLASDLTIKIPGGFTAASQTRSLIEFEDNGALVTAIATTTIGAQYIYLEKLPYAAFTASANLTETKGQIFFGVQ